MKRTLFILIGFFTIVLLVNGSSLEVWAESQWQDLAGSLRYVGDNHDVEINEKNLHKPLIASNYFNGQLNSYHELTIVDTIEVSNTNQISREDRTGEGYITIMEEGFEGTFPSGHWGVVDSDGITNGEYYWDDASYKPYNGLWSAWVAKGGENGLDPVNDNYANNMRSWMIYGPFDLSEAEIALLEFYYWNQSEVDFDRFSWLASADGSSFYGYTVSGDSLGWKYVEFDLRTVPTVGDLTGDSSVWIAFNFQSDSSVTGKGTFVDDILLSQLLKYPEIDIQYSGSGEGVSIVNGDPTPSVVDGTDFGSETVDDGAEFHWFSIRNQGSKELNLTGTPNVTIEGTNSSDFEVTAQPVSSIINEGYFDTFLVKFDPSGTGLRSAVIVIPNDDEDEDPYTFAIQGTGITAGDSYEPDNINTEAKIIVSGTPQQHSIVPLADQDWVKFILTTESGVTLETSGVSGDTRMYLYNLALEQVDYDNDNGTGAFSYIDRVCGDDALPAGTYYVKVDEFGNNSTIASYSILFNSQACLAGLDSYEPDNDPGQAKIIISGSPQTHSIYPVADSDWVSFTLTSESAITLETSGISGDTVIAILDGGGLVEEDNDSGIGAFSYIDRVCGVDALPAGTYFVAAGEYQHNATIPSYNLAFTSTSCDGPSIHSTYIPFITNGTASSNLIFSDDFSTGKAWTDESGGNIYRDTSNQWLLWQTLRNATRRYYIPINGNANDITFKFRFNVTDHYGNGMIHIGLVQDLTWPGGAFPGFDVTGSMIQLLSGSGNWVGIWNKYPNGTEDTVSNSAGINYGSGEWRGVTLQVNGLNWTFILYDQNGTEIGRRSGTYSSSFSDFNYIWLGMDYLGGTETMDGYFDDIAVYQGQVP